MPMTRLRLRLVAIRLIQVSLVIQWIAPASPMTKRMRAPGVVVRQRREQQHAQRGDAQPEIDRSQRPQARDDPRHQRPHQDDRDRQHGRVDADHQRVVAVARQRQRHQRHDGADRDADAERRSDDGRQTLVALGRGQRIRGHCLRRLELGNDDRRLQCSEHQERPTTFSNRLRLACIVSQITDRARIASSQGERHPHPTPAVVWRSVRASACPWRRGRWPADRR